MAQELIDLHPYIRYFDNRNLSRRYTRQERSAILASYVGFFCQFYTRWNNTVEIDSDVDETIREHHLDITANDGRIWTEMLELLHDTIRNKLNPAFNLPTEGLLTVDINNGVAVFILHDPDAGDTTHEEAMLTFKRWLRDKDTDEGKHIPNVVYELVEHYIRDSGWVR